MDRLMNSVPGRVVRKFMEDQAPNWAALIAWNALFAMFPIVIFAASLLGFALRFFGKANDAVYKTIFSALPTDPEQQLQLIKAVGGVKSQSGLLFIVGLLGLLWGGSALFGIMEQGFAVIYHTKPRDFIRQKLISVGMVLLFTLLVGIAVASSAILPLLKHIPDIPSFLYTGTAGILQVIIGVAAGFLLFGSIYYVIPNRRQELRKIIPGALVAGILFEAITLLFPLYLALNKGINQYGATFGLLFVLMTFFFFLGLITMVGVELNSVIYPVPIEAPGKDAHVVAPPESGPDGEGKLVAGRRAGTQRNGASSDGRRGVPARAALGLAVVASVVGVLLGRRSASSD